MSLTVAKDPDDLQGATAGDVSNQLSRGANGDLILEAKQV